MNVVSINTVSILRTVISVFAYLALCLMDRCVSVSLTTYALQDTFPTVACSLSLYNFLQMWMSVQLVLHHVTQILTVSILSVVLTVFAELVILVMERFPVQVYIMFSIL